MSRITKKTVAIRKDLDVYIRMTWAALIEAGYDASYSTALNLMLYDQVLMSVSLAKVGFNGNQSSPYGDAKFIPHLKERGFFRRLDKNLEELIRF